MKIDIKSFRTFLEANKKHTFLVHSGELCPLASWLVADAAWGFKDDNLYFTKNGKRIKAPTWAWKYAKAQDHLDTITGRQALNILNKVDKNVQK